MTDKPAAPQPDGTGSGPAVPPAGAVGTGGAAAGRGGSGSAIDGTGTAGRRRARRKDESRPGLQRKRHKGAGQHAAQGGQALPDRHRRGPVVPAAEAAAAIDPAEATGTPAAAATVPGGAAAGKQQQAAASVAPAGQQRDGGAVRQTKAGWKTKAARPGAAPGTAGKAPGNSSARRPLGIAAGAVLLLVTAAAAAAGTLSDVGSAAAEVPAVPAAVAAGNFTGVCPEPPRLLDSAADETDPEFSPVSASASTLARAVVFSDLSGTLPGSNLAELGARKPLVTIAKPSRGSGTQVRGSSDDGQTKLLAGVVPAQKLTEPAVLSVEPIGGEQALAGATMTYRAADGDLRGIAAANCTAPANDFWLVGASTTVGATAVLHLYNPTQTPSTVDLELVGSGGRIQAAGSRGLLLAPGESRSIVLGGLAAKQESLAVHVSSSGGPVAGTIQQSVLRGLTPGGVELLAPSADPGVQQVVAGVEVQRAQLARSISAQSGYGAAAPALDVVVPGGADAKLRVRVFGKDGEVRLPGGGSITAAAGTVTAVPLDSLPAGTYSVQITSNVSVAAAARSSRATGKAKPVDFAWTPAAARLGSEHLAVVPAEAGSSLVFAAPSGAATVKLVPVDRKGKPGKERVVKVPAGTTVKVGTSAGGTGTTALMVSATGDAVYGSQVVVEPGAAGISVLPIPAAVQGRQSVPVYLGY